MTHRRTGRRPPRRSAPHGPRVQLRVDSIAAGGEGVGRLADGQVVFVHRTAPGDLAEVELLHRKQRWGRGRLLRVLEPSPLRRQPPCRFYAECGGCTLEHLTYAAQLAAKARIVAEAFRHIGGVEVPPPEVAAAPLEQRYRNRVSFVLRRLGSGRVVAGFHALGEAHRVVDVDGGCLLPEEPIARVWDALRANWGPDAQRLPSGEQLRLTLRASAAGAVSLLVEGGYSPGRAEELVDRVAGLVAVWHRPGAAAPRLAAGAPGLPETWGDEALELSGAAFLQVNRSAAALLEEYVVAVAGEVAGRRLVDAYCGVGLLARRFARVGAEVVGLELDADAIAEARRGTSANARFEQGAVEELLRAHLPADLVILNPPRAGLHLAAAEALVAEPPHRIVYISCDPATLARDVRRLAPGFSPRTLRCFDLFPQTAHVETVVELVRSGAESPAA